SQRRGRLISACWDGRQCNGKWTLNGGLVGGNKGRSKGRNEDERSSHDGTDGSAVVAVDSQDGGVTLSDWKRCWGFWHFVWSLPCRARRRRSHRQKYPGV